jgi:hypothetical protein
MLSLLLLLQGATLPTFDAVRARECAALVAADPASAVVNANEWSRAGGGYRASGCLAEAYAAQGKYAQAAALFRSAALAAAKSRDGHAPQYWAQAGNAAIAAQQPREAIADFNAALAMPDIAAPVRANILIDRTRGYVAAGDSGSAAADLTQVRRIAPDNAAGWLLSATLARRMGQLADAQNFIITAASLSSADGSVALEAGNIAAAAGAYSAARDQWQQTIRLAPGSAQAETATRLLGQLAEQERAGSPAAAAPAATSPAAASPAVNAPQTR